MQAVRDKVAIESPEGNLWVGVIEQAVFDAHLHSTGGKYPSVAYVKEARGYFDTPEFEHVCMMLGIESAWVRSMVRAAQAAGDNHARYGIRRGCHFGCRRREDEEP